MLSKSFSFETSLRIKVYEIDSAEDIYEQKCLLFVIYTLTASTKEKYQIGYCSQEYNSIILFLDILLFFHEHHPMFSSRM
jgi:hypothetical protein